MKKNILFLLLLLVSYSVFSQVPASPVLILPPEEASVVSLTPTLEWQTVTGADGYFIFITDDVKNIPNPEEVMATSNSYSVPQNTLIENVIYYWRVQAHNSEGWSLPSPFFSFITVNTTPQGSIDNLQNQVTSISNRGALSLNQANILNNRLEETITQINQGHDLIAILYLHLFKLRVFILRISGMIPVKDAVSLNYSADGVIDLIQTVNKPGIVNLEPPKEFKLHQNYPNPFNPVTTIEYSIPDNAHVILRVYDLLGKEAATLIDKYQPQGSYIVNWNAGNFSSGIYIYKLSTGSYTESKKMILSK